MKIEWGKTPSLDSTNGPALFGARLIGQCKTVGWNY